MRRLHVLGRRELSLLVGGEDKLPTPEQLPLPRLQPECEEAAIPAQYGAVEDGVMLRTLQDFCFYHEGASRLIERVWVGGVAVGVSMDLGPCRLIAPAVRSVVLTPHLDAHQQTGRRRRSRRWTISSRPR